MEFLCVKIRFVVVVHFKNHNEIFEYIMEELFKIFYKIRLVWLIGWMVG